MTSAQTSLPAARAAARLPWAALLQMPSTLAFRLEESVGSLWMTDLQTATASATPTVPVGMPDVLAGVEVVPVVVVVAGDVDVVVVGDVVVGVAVAAVAGDVVVGVELLDVELLLPQPAINTPASATTSQVECRLIMCPLCMCPP
jgi:hypothetical protein